MTVVKKKLKNCGKYFISGEMEGICFAAERKINCFTILFSVCVSRDNWNLGSTQIRHRSIPGQVIYMVVTIMKQEINTNLNKYFVVSNVIGTNMFHLLFQVTE